MFLVRANPAPCLPFQGLGEIPLADNTCPEANFRLEKKGLFGFNI